MSRLEMEVITQTVCFSVSQIALVECIEKVYPPNQYISLHQEKTDGNSLHMKAKSGSNRKSNFRHRARSA